MKKVKNIYVVWLASFLLLFSFGSLWANDGIESSVKEENPPEIVYLPAMVLNVRDITPTQEEDFIIPEETLQRIWVQILSGDYKGMRIFIEHRSGGLWGKRAFPGYDFDHLQTGDKILLYVELNSEGIVSAHIDNHLRSPLLFQLFILFVLIMLFVAGLKGFKALLAIALSASGILFILLPLILRGYHPILVATTLSIGIALITFLLINGWSRKTISAIIGTTGGFVLAGLLAYISGNLANLSGFNSEEAGMLRFIPQSVNFNFQGILFAGIIIGALGAIMDVAMSIASAMEELFAQHPKIALREHIRSGVNIGKDIIGTMSNTLILAYTGSSIPLMLLFLAHDTPLIRVMNLDIIATEIVRALSGTIGLAITIPVTVFCSAFLCLKTRQKG